ncbi:MAG: Rne/Rng family ribonuclease [SAR324 cluster bacterium]|nr:Rne/Rng family ribonuclease [SAR324 cluster bacterium]MBL7036153.1 Rne/Rng family ribonuclease [SAR324 cluster bacterium]
MTKEIIINHTSHETRVAVMDGGVLSELYHEREKSMRVVDNIYKGKVLNVLPGMDSAFVDIGTDQAAFLHIDDILPEDEILGKPVKKNGDKQQIAQLIKEGQDVLVQVSKGPIGTKGARITSHVSIPGRNLVYLPTSQTLGVSRQISQEKERERLRDVVERLRPENSGFIIRTVAEGHTEEDLHSDINYLVSIWGDILEKYKTLPAPSLLHSDLNVIFRTIRDLFSADIRKLVVDDKKQYQKVRQFVRSYLPRYSSIIENYVKPEPVFDHFGIENEIDRALGNKVWLRSGGHLVIDQTEALTAVDVNTGRFVGKESHEKTILRTNIEAAEEIVYQLQLRNIGGIIIIDFIDMETQQHRQMVYQTLKDRLRTDKARSKILQISEMGLVEMTRKRDRENLNRYLRDHCPYCEGSGQIKSSSTVSYEAFREVRRSCRRNTKGSIAVYLHSDVYRYIQHEEQEAVQSLEEEMGRSISFKSSDDLHHEQFELYEY